MKVGDYVRFKTLSREIKIGKIIEIIAPDNDEFNTKKHCVYDLDNNEATVDDYIIKSSQTIEGVLEIGDYVNGKKVVDKWEEPGWFGYFIELEGEKTVPTIRKIKSIVTKEQFKNMEYKVGEDKE